MQSVIAVLVCQRLHISVAMVTKFVELIRRCHRVNQQTRSPGVFWFVPCPQASELHASLSELGRFCPLPPPAASRPVGKGLGWVHSLPFSYPFVSCSLSTAEGMRRLRVLVCKLCNLLLKQFYHDIFNSVFLYAGCNWGSSNSLVVMLRYWFYEISTLDCRINIE